MSLENIKDFCGIFGVFGAPNDLASKYTYYGLYAQQHRGQESAGIVSSDGEKVHSYMKMGLVNDVFKKAESFEKLKGHMAIGHVRYSTTGESSEFNIQPLLVKTGFGHLAIAHNGNLINAHTLRKDLESQGSIFRTTTDSEILIHLIAKSKFENLEDKIIDAVSQIKGAFSVAIMSETQLFIVRDPNGFRPLSYAKKDSTHIFASETCAFDLLDAEFIKEIKPGEMIIVDSDGVREKEIPVPKNPSFCIFELVYFSRPDSKLNGECVDKVRRKFGKKLAEEALKTVDADIVISVPDSSNTAALGFASASNIKFEIGLIRNHYIGRTFINPEQNMRDLSVKLKFNTVGGVLKGRKVVVVDDSIVRGTTLKKLVKLLKKAEPKEIHICISSPPVKHPCYYGMNFPTSEELIANHMSPAELKDWLKVDSLTYLSVESMVEAAEVSLDKSGFCTACFTGNYPENVLPTPNSKQSCQ
ncbi:MAG: amidophosphoribosyltransferase [Calditrichaeota bacterium]|nr:MAG: amidophosphoribosyltransferase [Calditrichota bacterium]